jgi:hypothetical protein
LLLELLLETIPKRELSDQQPRKTSKQKHTIQRKASVDWEHPSNSTLFDVHFDLLNLSGDLRSLLNKYLKTIKVKTRVQRRTFIKVLPPSSVLFPVPFALLLHVISSESWQFRNLQRTTKVKARAQQRVFAD